MEQELLGKVALVTGSSTGLGKHIALALARAGADVAVHYRSRREAGEEVVRQIEAMGRRAALLHGDLVTREVAESLVAGTVDALGRIDILVNNVGEFAYQKVRDHTPAEFERIIAGTIGATFYTTLAALPHMQRQGWGRVVNLGAAGAERAAGRVNIGPHLAGKSAVVSLTRTLALEEASPGLTFNVVSPGVIDQRDLPREEAVRMRSDHDPVGRPGTSEDIADAVLYLVSPRTGFVNGAVIQVTGGWQI